MKTLFMSVVVLVCAITTSSRALAEEKKAEGVKVTSLASVGCEAPEAGTPEECSFFGEGKKVLDKIGNLSVDLPKRKIYLIMVEGPESAEAFLYERAGEKKVNLSHWSGKSATDLRQEIEKAIMSNRGVHCIGEQTKGIIMKKGEKELKSEKGADAPATVKAVVSHGVQKLGDKFIRVTVFLLC